VVFANCSISSVTLITFLFIWCFTLQLWCVLTIFFTLFMSLIDRENLSVIQWGMLLKLFLTLLCPLSLNSLQCKALVIQDTVIIVNVSCHTVTCSRQSVSCFQTVEVHEVFFKSATSVYCWTLRGVSLLLKWARIYFPILLCQKNWQYLVWQTISVRQEVYRTETVLLNF
jgi:hypothetical protein